MIFINISQPLLWFLSFQKSTRNSSMFNWKETFTGLPVPNDFHQTYWKEHRHPNHEHKKCFIVFNPPSSSAFIYWAGRETWHLPKYQHWYRSWHQVNSYSFCDRNSIWRLFAFYCLQTTWWVWKNAFALELAAAYWVRWKFLPGSKDSVFSGSRVGQTEGEQGKMGRSLRHE